MKRLSPFVFASLVFHILAFLAFGTVIGRETGIAGMADGDPDRVFVLVVSEEDRIAVAPTPCPVDSPESVDSEKEEEKKEPEIEEPIEEEEVEEPEPPQKPPEVLAKEEPESPPLMSQDIVQEIPAPSPEIVEPQKKPKEDQKDSTASDPLVASDRHMRRSSLGEDLRDFQSQLLAALRQSTFFPQEALKGKRHGEVTVAFTINRSGTVTSVRVVLSSGSEVLDDAAQEIVRKASKYFPAFPAWVREERLNYTVPIHFKEKRSPKSQRTIRTRS